MTRDDAAIQLSHLRKRVDAALLEILPALRGSPQFVAGVDVEREADAIALSMAELLDAITLRSDARTRRKMRKALGYTKP